VKKALGIILLIGVFIACLIGGAMVERKHKGNGNDTFTFDFPSDPETMEMYIGLRENALRFKSNETGDAARVYSAIFDYKFGNGYMTLVCYEDGNVSTYFSFGGGMLGMSKDDQSIRLASVLFLECVRRVYYMHEKVTDFPLPSKNSESIIYANAGEDVYKIVLDHKSKDNGMILLMRAVDNVAKAMKDYILQQQ